VHQPAYEMGLLAAQALLQLLDGAKPQQSVPAPRLIVRESCRRLKP
jgi:LacI family transcriptional regulator